MRYLYLCGLLFLLVNTLNAQCNSPFPPSLTCADAPVICNLNGYCSTSGVENAIDTPDIFCGNIENNQWLAFVAGSADLELYLDVVNCSNEFGLQAQIFETNNCSDFTPVSNCFSPAYVTGGSLTAIGLTVGQTYYLMIDGWSVAICDYTIIILNGTTGVGINADAGADAYLCTTENLLLDGSNSTIGSNYSYQWTTTDGNIVSGATSLNPTVNSPGTYELTVTHNTFGCSAIDMVTVNQGDSFTTLATVSGSLDCNNTSVNLDGSGSSAGVAISYNWSTSNGNITGATDIAVTSTNSPGDYLLTVTNTNSGCQDTAWVTVISDQQIPNVSATGGTIDCISTAVQLNANSTTAGVSYSWTGPNSFSSALQSPTVNQNGTYTVSVTAPNGCVATTTTNVSGDNSPPDVSASGGSLNCTQNMVMLSANSATVGVSYTWTSPLGFSSDLQNPNVTEATDYTVVVTAPNGCTASATVSVNADNNIPDLTATGATLSCSVSNVQIMANSNTAGVSYAWTSTTGFSSGLQNPLVSEATDYTVIVTAPNGCTETATVTVSQNDLIPDAEAMGGIINCLNTSTQISGNSASSNVSYAWTGPNSFSSVEQNPIVSNAGDYTLTVTGENGCINTAVANVNSDTSTPDAVATGGAIDCINTSVQLSGNSATPDVTYNWTGPNNFSSSEQNPTVNNSGTYILTVTASNGCSNTASAEVSADADIPDAMATGGTIDCNNNSLQLMGSSSAVDVTYNWTGPNAFTSSEQNPVITESGDYTLTVSAANGCNSNAMTTVFLDNQIPNITAVGGDLDCSNNPIQLSGSSNTANVTYSWSGPNSYSSSEQNPMVSQTGDYTLTVTAENGCTAQSIVSVATDAEQPEVNATGGTQTCNDANIQLNGSSTTIGVTYNWTGPNAFSSSEQNPIVSISGEYILTVTAANGCSANAYAIVFTPQIPDVTSTGGAIDCINTSVQLLGNSATPDVAYNWTGPNNFSSSEQNPTVNNSGTYTLTVTASNGCSNTANAEVSADADIPDAMATGGTIDCNNNSLQLMGSSSAVDVTYNWTGPNAFTSSEQNPVVTESGDYILTVSAANGCNSNAMTTVFLDNQIPDITAVGGAIDCTNTSIQLTGNSNTADVTYNWTGPNNFTSSEQNPIVTQGGIYNLTVSSLGGCNNSASATVSQSNDIPSAVATGGIITCTEENVQLTGSSDSNNISYSWSGPNAFTSVLQNPVVTEAGTYILTVENVNGCTSSDMAEVELNISTPDVTATGGMLSCTESSVQLTGSSITENVSYSWTGPNNYFSDLQNPTATSAGTYLLTVTAANGCINTTSTEITTDAGLPDANATGGQQTCDNLTITLTGSTNTTGASYTWTGPNNFSSSNLTEDVITAGNYIFTVIAPNGCTTAATATVLAAQKPEVSATGGTLTCNQSEILVNTTADMTDLAFDWTGPNSFTSNLSSPTLTDAGQYTLIADAGNNCTDTFLLNIPIDTIAPDITTTGGILSCGVPQIQLSSSSTSTIDEYIWTSPTGIVFNEANPLITEAGLYNLQVFAPNGCTNQTTAFITADTLTPQISLSALSLDCDQPTGNFNPTINPAGGNYTWTGPNSFTANILNPLIDAAGEYSLSVISNNGCSNSTNITVTDNSTSPDVIAVGGNLSCDEPTITLQTESTQTDLTYSWTGPNDFISDQAHPTITEAGDYFLSVTDSGGCTFETTTTVGGSSETVELTLSSTIISCNNPSVEIQSSSPDENLTFVWTGPDNFNSTAANPFVTIGGDYSVTASSQGGCSTTEMISIEADTLAPDATAVGGLLTCVSTNVQLTGNSTTTGVAYAWTGPNSFTSTAQNPIVAEGGAYNLTVTANNGCTEIEVANVIEDTIPPTANAGADFELNCEMPEANLQGNANAGGSTYSVQWFTDDGSITNNPQVLSPSIDRGGTYIMEAINADNGCTTSDTIVITEAPNILRYIVPTVMPPSCFGAEDGQISIDSIFGGTHPIYFSVNYSTLTTETLTENLGADTYYIVAADAAGCFLEMEIELENPSFWSVNIGGNTNIAQGDSTQLNTDISIVSVPVESIEWLPAEDLNCSDCPNPIASPNKTTTYTIQVTNADGCIVSDKITITVNGEDNHVYIPNAFSPNGDLSNDAFTVYSDEMVTEVLSLEIFDRWGNEIFAAQNFLPNDDTKGWDGRYQGKYLDTGVYIYQCILQYDNGQTAVFKGDVSLFR